MQSFMHSRLCLFRSTHRHAPSRHNNYLYNGTRAYFRAAPYSSSAAPACSEGAARSAPAGPATAFLCALSNWVASSRSTTKPCNLAARLRVSGTGGRAGDGSAHERWVQLLAQPFEEVAPVLQLARAAADSRAFALRAGPPQRLHGCGRNGSAPSESERETHLVGDRTLAGGAGQTPAALRGARVAATSRSIPREACGRPGPHASWRTDYRHAPHVHHAATRARSEPRPERMPAERRRDVEGHRDAARRGPSR
jgi:hypothetical protein